MEKINIIFYYILKFILLYIIALLIFISYDNYLLQVAIILVLFILSSSVLELDLNGFFIDEIDYKFSKIYYTIVNFCINIILVYLFLIEITTIVLIYLIIEISIKLLIDTSFKEILTLSYNKFRSVS